MDEQQLKLYPHLLSFRRRLNIRHRYRFAEQEARVVAGIINYCIDTAS